MAPEHDVVDAGNTEPKLFRAELGFPQIVELIRANQVLKHSSRVKLSSTRRDEISSPRKLKELLFAQRLEAFLTELFHKYV